MSATDQAEPIPVDKQDQVDQIQAGLLPGESIIAVYDSRGGGTGARSTPSPSSATSACSESSPPVAPSPSVGSATYEIEFRGQVKAKHAHDVILGFMS